MTNDEGRWTIGELNAGTVIRPSSIVNRPLGYLGPTIRQHLASLSLFSTDDGVLTFEHSDILSALLVARSSLDQLSSV